MCVHIGDLKITRRCPMPDTGDSRGRSAPLKHLSFARVTLLADSSHSCDVPLCPWHGGILCRRPQIGLTISYD